MKSNLIKMSGIAALSAILSACVVAPPQPIGYRMTSPVLPTYVNGQYVGMQPSNYVAPATTTTTTVNTPATATSPATSTTTSSTTAANTTQPAPVYLQSTQPSVVYAQAPQPVYATPYYAPTYYPYGPSYYSAAPYPYYAPYYGGYPWFGGIGVGIGFRVRIH